MTDLSRVKLAKILYSARFWVATLVLYLTSRNISTSHIFQLIGFYYLMAVLLEYPTGVIGDYYSHKWSVFLGYISLALSYTLLSFSGGIIFYGISLFFLALGSALVSGSDNALLHSISKDFRKDFSEVKTYGTIVAFIAISIGGFVSVIDLRIPLYLTAIFLLAAAFSIFTVKIEAKGKTEENNLIGLGIEGVKYAFRNLPLLNILILSSLIGAFFFSFKWLYNPLFQALEINVASWGILAGSAILLIAAGAKFYAKFFKLNIFLMTIFLVTSVLMVGYTAIPLIALSGMYFSHFMRGYFETKLMVDLNAAIDKNVRSSVISLNSLMIRGGAMTFMFLGGIIIEKFSIMTLMLISVFTFILLGFYPIYKMFGVKSYAKSLA